MPPASRGDPAPAPVDPDTPSADIRIGYARGSTLTQELQTQLGALAAKHIPRDKIFAEKISTRVRVRPQFEAALTAAREIKTHAPHCRVIFTVYEMKRLGRDAAELTTLADHLTAHGLVLEMLAGPLQGMYDPSGPGRLLFGFFAAMAETERENIREATLEGLDTAARKGNHGGRPPVITDDMLHTVLRRRAQGETVETIQPDLLIPTGRRKGQSPSLSSIYRALAEHEKAQAYPEAIETAHADFAALQQRDRSPESRWCSVTCCHPGAQSGSHSTIGTSAAMTPSSIRSIAAAAVNYLLTDATRNCVSDVHTAPVPASATPADTRMTTSGPRITNTDPLNP